jgi:hypothetical protein
VRAQDAREAFRPDLDRRSLRQHRAGELPRGRPDRAEQPVLGEQIGRRSPRPLVLRDVRFSRRDHAELDNYGPFQHPEKFIPLFITNAIEKRPLPLYGDGRNVRDWIYVEDNCRAIELAGRRGTPGEVYNIGAGEERRNVDIARKIVELTGADEALLTFVSDRPGHDRRYSLDARKIRALGWRPRVRFDEGLAKTVRWYAQNDLWWRPVKEGSFKRYYAKLYRGRFAEASQRKEKR